MVLALGPGSRRRKKTVILGRYAPIGWSPVRGQPPPEASHLHREFEEAIAQGDLSAALSAQMRLARLAIGQVVEDSYTLLGEVFITDEGIARGPADVLGSLLHEAAHGVAQRRGVKDTSRRGEYHNARFRTVAEELGLRADSRDPRFGWSRTTLAAGAEALYAPTIAELARALAHNSAPAAEPAPITAHRARLPLRRSRPGRARHAQGPRRHLRRVRSRTRLPSRARRPARSVRSAGGLRTRRGGRVAVAGGR